MPPRDGQLPGTDDLGAAAGDDLGAGLSGTRGDDRKGPRSRITGSVVPAAAAAAQALSKVGTGI